MSNKNRLINFANNDSITQLAIDLKIYIPKLSFIVPFHSYAKKISNDKIENIKIYKDNSTVIGTITVEPDYILLSEHGSTNVCRVYSVGELIWFLKVLLSTPNHDWNKTIEHITEQRTYKNCA